MIRLYGIPNCDTMKKARRWLDEHGVAYDFHDYKKQGLDEALLRAWVAELGWERLANRQGTTRSNSTASLLKPHSGNSIPASQPELISGSSATMSGLPAKALTL